MAKKVMLFSLTFFFFCLAASIVHAKNEEFTFSKEEQNFAEEIAQIGQKHGMIAIREKHKELKNMIGQFGKNDQIKVGADTKVIQEKILNKNTSQLKIFVSSSMSRPLLKQYVKSARQYGATLVFRGLPEGTFRGLSELVYEITDGEERATSLQIDDTAFAEYGISNVPTFILEREENILDSSNNWQKQDKYHVFDKVSGNIGIRRALQEISENGDMYEEAKALLDRTIVCDEENE